MESELKKGAPPRDGSRGFLLQKPTLADPQLTLLPPRPPVDAFLRSSSAAVSSPMLLAASPFPANHGVGEKPFSFSSLLAGVVNSSSASVLQLKEANFPEADSVKGVKEDMSSRESPGERVTRFSESASKVVGGADGATSRTSTARFKAMPPSRLPIPSTSYVTIPPGLSPTTLLDSPVLFATHQCEPSPTTGTFPLPPLNAGTKPWASKSFDISEKSSGFVFKPFAKLGSRSCLPALTSLASMGISHQQALEQVQTQAQAYSRPSTISSSLVTMPPTPMAMAVPSVSENKTAARNQVSQFRALHEEEKMQEPRITESTAPEEQSDYVQVSSLTQVERPSNDGYNWRKYGQKQVKGRENPRSYYKCSHPNCLMKKKVEQNLDGHITEIIYRGEHNHPRPQAPYRTSQRVAASNTLAIAKDDGTSVQKADNINHFKSADVELSSRLQCQTNHHSNSNPELSSPSISDEEGTKLSGGDGNEDELDGKRRKIERDIKGTVLVPKTICEPRVVVQTRSEFEGLDDGYRWRKYGQKMVKGNPHPRSYYKCSNIGCPVRKHVERSPSDPNAVITTYEGRHNHDVPAAKFSSHNTIPTAGASPSAAQATIVKLGSVLRNGGSSQGDGSEFANVASIVARHLEKAQAERNAVALQFQSGVQSSSSYALRKDNKEDAFLSFVKSEPNDSQAALKDNSYADGNARSCYEGVNQFSEMAAGKIVTAIEPKKEQWDGFINANALPYQSSSTSIVEELRGSSGVLGP